MTSPPPNHSALKYRPPARRPSVRHTLRSRAPATATVDPHPAHQYAYAALRDSKTLMIASDEHDVIGDGCVVFKAAPGHTAGHQILYVKLAETGPDVLSGDLYRLPQSRSLQRVPAFDFNPEW